MAKNILILGAGRSSASLISYASRMCSEHGWLLTAGDLSEETAKTAIAAAGYGEGIRFDISEDELAAGLIRKADVVISLLPAHLHSKVAAHCLEGKTHLVTASYVSEEMKSFDEAAKQNGLLFLNECGLDPGIDHMSAMEIIHRIKNSGGKIKAFRSFTGGLIAPATDPGNPWRYKFTWNARNVVMAGQGFAIYREENSLKRIAYQQLFSRTVEINVPGSGKFDGYANRDSLKYITTYGLNEVETMIRGTLRYRGFCQAWNILVQLGCCEDQGELNTSNMSHRDFMSLFLPGGSGAPEQKISEITGVAAESQEMSMLQWTGLFENENIGLDTGTPAQILEHILNKKWKMLPGDLDQVVMWHQFVYTLNGSEHEIQASLVSEGVENGPTAMARTVGLPAGIAARLILEEKIKVRGVQIPVLPEIYEPVLEELKTHGIELREHQIR
jgi:saccharopine dehydrogenase (NADP+, L-glutamate forming)